MVLHSKHYGHVFVERFGNFKMEGTMEMVLPANDALRSSHSSFLQVTGHPVLAWSILSVFPVMG